MDQNDAVSSQIVISLLRLALGELADAFVAAERSSSRAAIDMVASRMNDRIGALAHRLGERSETQALVEDVCDHAACILDELRRRVEDGPPLEAGASPRLPSGRRASPHRSDAHG